jgi:hypothetical protein
MAYGSAYSTIPGLVASGDLSSAQFKLVKVASTAGKVVVGASNTDKVIGVLQNDPTDGQAAEVAFLGMARALAEASVAYGDRVTCSTTGRVKSTTNAGDVVVGHALNTTTTSAGDLIPLLLSGIFKY